MKNPNLKLGKRTDALPVVQVEAMPSFPVFIGSIGGLLVLIKLELIVFVHIIMGCLKLSRKCRGSKEYQPHPIDPDVAQGYLDWLMHKYNGTPLPEKNIMSSYTPLIDGTRPTLYGHTRGEVIELNYISSPTDQPNNYTATKEGRIE